MSEEIIKYSLLIVLTIYSILLTLTTFICITYILRLRRNSVCRKCKLAFDRESNAESEKTVQTRLNLEYQNKNKNTSLVKTRKKLELPDAELPLEIHHYEELMERIKIQQPELYQQVLEPLQKAIRERIKVDNQFTQIDSSDQVQCSDVLRPTYDEEIYNSSEDVYDIFVNPPKRIPNQNLKNLQPSSSETSQNNETFHLEAKQFTPTKDCPQKIVYNSETSAEPERTVQRKINLESENINEKASPFKTRKKLVLMPDYSKKCRKKRDEVEATLKEHSYEKIVDTEKTRQSDLYYKAVMEQLRTTMGESIKTDSIEQGQYCDMLSHTYEKLIYNNPDEADDKTPKRSISFRTSFGMKDHLKYLQPSSSHTSEDDIYETTYLEAKQFIPTEDCPQKLRSLCSLQNQVEIEEKATSWLPPTRIRTRSESSKGFFDFLKIKK